MAITITGTLTLVRHKRDTDPDYLGMRKYSPNSERYIHRLNCCLTTTDGTRYFFDSAAVREVVGNCPGAAVVTFDIEGEACNWWISYGEPGDGVATAERPNRNGLEAKVKVGDVITVRATVKAVKEHYIWINRVKMVK